jgi:hypothetical protein
VCVLFAASETGLIFGRAGGQVLDDCVPAMTVA